MSGRRNPPVVGVLLLACAAVAGVCIGVGLFWWLVVIGWDDGLFAAVVIVLSLFAAAATLAFLIVEGIWALRGRGEDQDALDEDLRSRIDEEASHADTPLPAAEATRVNQEFAGLINADLRELRRVDEDLARFYLLGGSDGC